jgi:hypothetical protein
MQRHVSGRFGGLGFSFAVDGTSRTARIYDRAGSCLIESILVGGIETTTYLDRLTLFGSPGEEPYLSGDVLAMAELAKRPEIDQLEPLGESFKSWWRSVGSPTVFQWRRWFGVWQGGLC